ncbi:unnamed protein product [Acanthoscelides obtectus]|uniref:DDE Tnp4 domain-containing protein n=1 Tax=Acanthoscelides obtectus TaxID=200917 RepID=A0A9P0KB23_ACAOB|nr:unnamed protein product [Acanthoscelides obtectus]CAH1973678.1 unnamed protein product [Acanthoscelides obtectus]CAH2004652.1 unnamed protein product [Acanthoscelides obtectus]CAK1622973.1 Protein ALP1-like [Acanthoscelides obtectus]CAK1636051.1 Protein ALP1-like [Acanthoscelides obtectus]
MNKKAVFLLYLLYLRKKKCREKRRRRYWVHPILSQKYVEGAFYTMFEKFREHDEKFFNYFRMSTATFDYLLEKLSCSLQRQDTQMRLCVPPKEMLAITLRYLASGNTFTDMHYAYRLGVSTISKIIKDVCHSIWNILKDEYLPTPTVENWKDIADGFTRNAQFPHCIGAVDGKHVRIMKFPGSGSMNLNYKHFFSIVLMAIADSNYRFIYVDIGAFGKDCDSSVFKETVFWKLLQQNALNIPHPSPLISTGDNLPFVLVGDEAFALSQNLLRPYGGHSLNINKRIFNYRLCRARRYIECSFGILVNKWRIFHRAINVGKEYAKDIVKACIILHNLVREKDGTRVEDMYAPDRELQNLPPTTACRGGRAANDVRDKFAEFFVSPEGSLPWQMSKI